MASTTFGASLPVAELSGDVRSSAVEQHRSKDRRVKYRNVNMNLIGRPMSEIYDENSNYQTWNNRNKFKMPMSNPAKLRGPWSRRNIAHSRGKSQKFAHLDTEVDAACTRPKRPLPTLERGVDELMESYNTRALSDIDDSSVEGVTYSFDGDGPTAGEEVLCYAVSQAVEKFETKELNNLIKNEYEIVDSSESSDDEEFELI